MRKRRKLLFVVVILAFLGLLFEGLCSLAAWIKYGTLSVARLNELDAGNTYAFELGQKNPTFASYVRPHPWLGIVPAYSDEYPYRDQNIEDFPAERDPSKFTILLTGGSVAQMLGLDQDANTLTKAIEKRCSFGKPVRVLNAACGATRQPRQMIALGLYGDAVDAVINLDGFNESQQFVDDPKLRFDFPATWFADLNPLVSGSYDQIGASWTSNQVRGFSMRHDSRAAFFATQLVRRGIRQADKPATKWQRQFALNGAGPDYNLRQYQKNLRLMHAMAVELGIRDVYFIQPCPAISKTLTAEEKRSAGSLEYATTYQAMADGLLSLKGVPVVSLLDCYAETQETVYVDAVHCSQTRGYAIMADRVAAELAKLWKVEQKTPAALSP